MTHFANKYIGLPYVAGAQGSDSFDCWGFVRFVLLHEYGHNVPPVNINPDNLRDVLHAFRTDLAFQAFNKVKTPQDGDVVLMRQHCVRGSGVVFQNIHSLNASGWYLHSFYRVKK